MILNDIKRDMADILVQAGVLFFWLFSSSSQARQSPTERASSTKWEELDNAYFQSYSQIGIHEEMIKDHVRTETYMNAIIRHQNLISGKVVMDVGCGSGILSIFRALAGARRDHARMETYMNAIMRHQNLISGKVVMDVGCGTGILSIFRALAGARRTLKWMYGI